MHRITRSAVLTVILAGALAGCATPFFAGLTLSEFGLATSVVATAATGKGLGEHAMDVATGRDCRVLEGLARDDRSVCERKNSPALEDDWKGLASLTGETAPSAHPGGPGRESRDGRDG